MFPTLLVHSFSVGGGSLGPRIHFRDTVQCMGKISRDKFSLNLSKHIFAGYNVHGYHSHVYIVSGYCLLPVQNFCGQRLIHENFTTCPLYGIYVTASEKTDHLLLFSHTEILTPLSSAPFAARSGAVRFAIAHTIPEL